MRKTWAQHLAQGYRTYALRQGGMAAVVFIVLNGAGYLFSGNHLDFGTGVRLALSSLAIGWLWATVMWFLHKKNWVRD